MARTVTALTGDVLTTLPESVQRCAFWELDPVQRSARPSIDVRRAAKRDWLSSTLLDWGCCGQVVLVDDAPAGFVMYAPAAYVPSSDSFATAPVSGDAVLLMTGQVFRGYERGGLGRLLVQSTVKDLARRRIRAVEAFAPRRTAACTGDPDVPCLLPAPFLSHVGFRTVRAHPVTSRMRLDVRSAVSWREDVEQAVDRLLGTIRSSAPTAN